MRTRGSKREPLAERDENARAKEAAQDKKGSRKLTDTQLLDHALQEIDKFGENYALLWNHLTGALLDRIAQIYPIFR